jgi:hypothetical protein
MIDVVFVHVGGSRGLLRRLVHDLIYVKINKMAAFSLYQTVSVALSKTAVAKATHSKAVSRAAVVLGTGIPPKATATSVASMSNIAVAVTCSGAVVLKSSIRMKRPDGALSLASKGTQAKLDAGPPSASVISWFRFDHGLTPADPRFALQKSFSR